MTTNNLTKYEATLTRYILSTLMKLFCLVDAV